MMEITTDFYFLLSIISYFQTHMFYQGEETMFKKIGSKKCVGKQPHILGQRFTLP